MMVRSNSNSTTYQSDGNLGSYTAPIAGFVAAALSLMVPLFFGMLRPEYSHIRNYISELGERGAPYASWVNWAGFLPIGLLVFLFLYAASKRLPVKHGSIFLLSSVGWGYIVSAFFPCDPGCPERGSTSQLVHNLAAIICFLATVAGMVQMAISFASHKPWQTLSQITIVCSLLVAAGFILMLLPDLQTWRGMSQRLAETAVFGWIAIISFALYRRTTHPQSQPT